MSNMTNNLLVELFVEELPPKALKKLDAAFSEILLTQLQAMGLASKESTLTSFATPRRLAAHITHIASQAADKAISQKLMPVAVGLGADGKATPALLKKLQALGADESAVPNLKRVMDGKAEALFYESTVSGATLAMGLQQALNETIAKLPIPKVMTYQLTDGWTDVKFVRPAHGLVALHGADIVPVTALGLTAGRTTQGHRFEATNKTIAIKDADSYEAQMRDEGAVIASYAARRASITSQLATAASLAGIGLQVIEDEALLDEVTSLVERPNVLTCQFEREFLDVPQECLILTMKANQKYFPLLDAKGKLSNKFLVVSNITPGDPSAVIEGNERVVRPRLADAKFFFDQDRKKTLESRVEGLAKVVYHNKLGTQGERTERVVAIAKAIVKQLSNATLPFTVQAKDEFDVLTSKVEQAARLAKTDLLTDMVGEFPELQGIMGGYYARHDGLRDGVAIAIEDHYKPRFAGDALPRNHTGTVVALADKLETLVGMFGIGNLPTGDKDPYALRRHALGVIRLLGSSREYAGLDFLSLIKMTIQQFPEGMLTTEQRTENVVVVPLSVKLGFFLQERAISYIREMGNTTQEAEAVAHISHPVDYQARLQAIRKTKESYPNELALLANADKRARNILNKSDAASEVLVAEMNLMTEEAEKTLLQKTRELRSQVDQLMKHGNFEESLLLTVQISQSVTDFFANVMVNADDENVKKNRFRLLHEVVGLTNCVANLSKLAN